MAMSIEPIVVTTAKKEAILELYVDAGVWEDWWDVEIIPLIVKQSFKFVALYAHNELIGMGRAISDGVMAAYILDVCVRTDFREQGWGKKIIRKLVKELEEAGIRCIQYIVPTEARNFCEHKIFKRRWRKSRKYRCFGA